MLKNISTICKELWDDHNDHQTTNNTKEFMALPWVTYSYLTSQVKSVSRSASQVLTFPHFFEIGMYVSDEYKQNHNYNNDTPCYTGHTVSQALSQPAYENIMRGVCLKRFCIPKAFDSFGHMFIIILTDFTCRFKKSSKKEQQQ